MDRFPFVTRLADYPQETEGLHRIPIALTGSWVKDGKKFSITYDDLKQMVDNFSARKNKKVVVDFEHASENPKVAAGKAIPAAGWIEAMELVGATVFASIDWTKDAAQMIKDKAYRFVSPAIDWFATNKDSGEAIGTALSSLALTNHPFLEELPALCLSSKGDDDKDESANGKSVIHIPVPDGASVKVKVKASDCELDDTGALVMAEDKEPYGDVQYADPGYQADKKKRYPLDTEKHIRSAWSYINQSKNAAKYEGDQASSIKSKIVAAWKRDVDKDGPPSAKAEASVKLSDEMSLDRKRSAVYDALQRECGNWPNVPFGIVKEGPWVQDLYDDYAIVQCNGKLWKVGYAIDEKENVTLQPPTQVKLEYVEASTMATKTADQLTAEAEALLKLSGKSKEPPDGEDDDVQCSDGEKLTTKAGATIPRLSVRKIKAGDAVGKLGHHAVMSDGKMLGYVTHGDMTDHMKQFATPPPKESTQMSTKSLAEEIKEVTGRPFSLSDIKEHIEFSVSHRIEFTEGERAKAARKLLLSDGFTAHVYDAKKARRLLASGKITMQDYCDVEEASDEVGKLVDAGRFLPGQRESLIELCLSDKALFDSIASGQAKVIEFAEAGFKGSGGEITAGGNADAEVMQLTDKMMKDNPTMKKRDAIVKVLSDNKGLRERYDKAHKQALN